MAKIIAFDEEARRALERGMNGHSQPPLRCMQNHLRSTRQGA